MRSRSRTSLMTPGRWVLLIVIVLTIIFLLLNLYYRSTQQDIWKQEREAEQVAAKAAGLVQITSATKHIWDQIAWVVKGTDESGQEKIVWVVGDKADSVLASSGVSKEQITKNVQSIKPDADIIRVQPGLLDGEKIWEVFYKRHETIDKYYYEFYRFTDGSFVTIYNLPSKFSDGTE
ncbi:DUF5590 domain-containing protein [Paenibacillus sp. GCM10012307]|uniref:DUF5590 domain-containing protein n=1 Tax=Paenibacillus roseus TaxID=2798579 RepID=A0A934J2H1_9BACL|nr:DUF5590 domain-containing protein [Paenibacillus roseus]MBJ6363572.1 DUF5590 domain-containing protein [Paenibacillus roseus]